MGRRAGVRVGTVPVLLAALCTGVSFSADKTVFIYFIYCIYLLYLRGSLFLRHKTRQRFGFSASIPLLLCDTAPGSWKMLNPLAEMETSGTGGRKSSFHLGYLNLFLAFLCLLNPKCWCRRMGCKDITPCAFPAGILGADTAR